MPPKQKRTREQLVMHAVMLVQEKGPDALNARGLAKAVGCSTQPIFSQYSSMDELKKDVMTAAGIVYRSFLEREIRRGKLPPHRAAALGYIRFAHREKALFRFLFMQDCTEECMSAVYSEDVAALLRGTTGLPECAENRLYADVWMYVHGIASMVAVGLMEWDGKQIRKKILRFFDRCEEWYGCRTV